MDQKAWDFEVDRIVMELSVSMHDKMMELARMITAPGVFEAAIGQVGSSLMAAAMVCESPAEREQGLELLIDLVRDNLKLLDLKRGD